MDIEKIIKELTLEEKLMLLEGADMGFTNPIERLGIPRILLADGPHGIRVVKGTDPEGNDPYLMNGDMYETTALPCEAAMASAWNLLLLEQAGHEAGEECQYVKAGVLLGPGVNGKRSPLAGRNFEYYSEDPYLSGKLAAAFIRGVQAEGVGTCLKHYVLNDQETRRTTIDVHVEERAWHEIYLKPFAMAMEEAQPWSIMASYNKTNGEQLCENHRMLKEILREKLHYEGAVVSDWSGVKDKIKSVKNGLDLQMPGQGNQLPLLLEAVKNQELSETEIEEPLRRVLALVKKAVEGRKEVSIDWDTHHETAVKLAEEGIVLLKNEDRILPLKKEDTIAVIGELALYPLFAGGGSSVIEPRKLDIPLSCIQEKAAEVKFAAGYHGNETDEGLLLEAGEAAAQADHAVIFVGDSSSEGLDRTTFGLPDAQLQLIQKVTEKNPNTVVVVQAGSAIEYRQFADSVKGIFHAWIFGEGGGNAITNLLFGDACPSGKLSETFPIRLEHTPSYGNFPGYKDDVYYQEGILTGYRYYDTKKLPVQYPFGYGLSYTTFAYAGLHLSNHTLTNGETLEVSLTVENTGTVAGAEVIQIYVADPQSHMFRPDKELKGFAKVFLEPGEKKTVTVLLDEMAFSYYVPHLGRFAVESGTFEILAGASAADIRLRESLEFESQDEVRPLLQEADQFREFLEDARYEKYAQQILEKFHIEDNKDFYKLCYGAPLVQLPGLFSFMGIQNETGQVLVNKLVNREEIA